MSEMTMFETGNLPAFAKNRELSSLAKSLAGGGGGGGGKRISIKGGVFRLIHEGKQIAAVDERYLDVVVVNAAEKISRTFYAGAWDPENPAPLTAGQPMVISLMPLLHRRSLQLAQPAHRTSRVQVKASHVPAVLTSG
jgi:hypothetical protein